MNWQYAYQTTFRQTVEDLKADRRAGTRVHRDVYGELCDPSELEDDEIDSIARGFAERLTAENINRYAAGEPERKAKRGEAQ